MDERRRVTLFQSSITDEDKIKTTVIEFDDKRFVREKIVTWEQLRSFDFGHFIKPIKVEDIMQKGVGNCYFLSALSSLLENDPEFLRNVIRFKKGKFHVKLFDANDPTHCYIYILDPTTFTGMNTNKHKHDIIFILEKAYALHRILLEPTNFTEFEKHMLQVYKEAGNDSAKAIARLLDLEEERRNKMMEELRGEIAKLAQVSTSDLRNLSTREKELYKLWQVSRGNANDVLDAYMKTQEFMDKYDLQIQLKYVLEKEGEMRIDYFTALTRGFEKDSFIALLGPRAMVESIEIKPPLKIPDIFTVFLPMVHDFDMNEFDDATSGLIKKIFGDMTDYALYFICSIKNTNPSQFVDAQLLYNKEKKSLNPHQFLKMFFEQDVDWLVDTNDRKNHVLALLTRFIDETLPYKRGLGKYTKTQLDLYEKIQQALMANKLVTVSTREIISSDSKVIEQNKGLMTLHSYMVMNSFKSEGVIYLLLRNPWGYYVRDYVYKQKMIGDEQVRVLSAEEKNQLPNLFATKALSFVGKDSPRAKRKEKIARPDSPIDRKEGAFPLTLEDLERRFINVTIAERPQPIATNDTTFSQRRIK